jgi:CheY-like chemotaxis protein
MSTPASIEINIHPAVSSTSNPVVQDYNIIHLTKDPETGNVESKLELIVKDNADNSITPKYMSPPLRRAKEDVLRSLITDYIVQLNKVIAGNLPTNNCNASPHTSKTIECKISEHMVSNLSHRVKTPLTAITSGIQLMYNYEHNEFVGRILDYLMQSSVELTKFVNDIIDFYYINQGILELEQEQTSLVELITDVYDVYASQMKEEQISFSYNIDTGCPEKFVSDKKRLSQIFVNLVNNSISALSLGESSNINSANANINKAIHLSCSLANPINSNPRIRILIQDTGIGVNLATADNLFHPFYLSVPTNDCITEHPAPAHNPGFPDYHANSNSIGLGLAITRMLLHKIGHGTIKFVKPSDIYTCAIQFELNVSSLTIPNNQILTQVIHPVDKQIILIDDNIKNLALLKQIISNLQKKQQTTSSNDINIVQFHNPTTAYKQISACSKSGGLILLDIKMAGMSGYDIIQGLDTSGIASNYRIVILSALPKASILAKIQSMVLSPCTRDNIIIAGKPYNITELKSHIQWIAGHNGTNTMLKQRVTTI